MKPAIRSRRKIFGQLLEHARRQPHLECCGILAGQRDVITKAFPARNAAADPVRNYLIAPREIERLLAKLRTLRLQFPSALDGRERAFAQRHRAGRLSRSHPFHCHASALCGRARARIFHPKWARNGAGNRGSALTQTAEGLPHGAKGTRSRLFAESKSASPEIAPSSCDGAHFANPQFAIRRLQPPLRRWQGAAMARRCYRA